MKKKILKKIGKLSIIERSWDYREELGSYICEGTIKNTGIAEQRNIYIVGAICRQAENKPIKTITRKIKIIRLANYYYIGDMKPEEEKDFIIEISIPEAGEVIRPRKLLKNMSNLINEGHILPKLFTFSNTNYYDSRIRKFRKTKDAKSVIFEEDGTRRIEMMNEEWETKKGKIYQESIFISKGTVKNTGTINLEDIHVISILVDKEKHEPLTWDVGLKTYKAFAIYKIDYLKAGEEQNFVNHIFLPKKSILKKGSYDIDDIEQKITQGEIQRKIDLIYEKTTVDEEAVKRLNIGNSYYRIADFDKAIKEYEEGLKLVKDDYRFYLNLGLALYKLGNFKESIEYFQYLYKKQPDSAKVKYLMAISQLQLEFYDEALIIFRDLVKNNPNDYKSMYNIACIYFLKNDISNSLAWLEKSLDIDKEFITSTARKDPQLFNFRKNEEFIKLIYS